MPDPIKKADADFWKRKLAAYLHDPPHKPYGIANHAATVKSNRLAFGLPAAPAEGFDPELDHVAAAADRFVFPNPRKSWNGKALRTDWIDEGLPFIHPFCGTMLRPHAKPVTRDVAEDWMSSALNGIVSGPTREDFIKAWRLWMERLARQKRDGAELFLPYLVADTRIPDHTIWQHMSLVSALQGCNGKPAFLLFQLGPVQSFIRQARKTIDLWAGSYLLSYLAAHAMEVLIRVYGPDHLIFPQVRGNALIDHLLADILENALELTEAGYANRQRNELLLPTLPNRFLALVPADDEKIPKKCEKAVRDKWKEICSDVHDFINQRMGTRFPGWDELWREQQNAFPRIEMIVQPLLSPSEALERLQRNEPPWSGPPNLHPVALNKHWAESCIGREDWGYYDPRNYRSRREEETRRTVMIDADGRDLPEGAEPEIVNPGYAWPLSYMTAEWKFGALKAARGFRQTGAFGVGCETRRRYEIPKDQLTGEQEVLGGRRWEEFWQAVAEDEILGGQRHFPHGNQRFGLLTVVKRLFAKAHLGKKFGFDVHRTIGEKIKSTYYIATGKECPLDQDEEQLISDLRGDKYYAVLCLDGDRMGKWLSGENAPPLLGQLSGDGVKSFFKDNWSPPPGVRLPAENVPRALTPSYHAAFSEALANFASYCVKPIIDHFNGQLIYAGGDDVLAMLPAHSAIDCADALQMAFRGLKPEDASPPAARAMLDIFDYEWCEMVKKNYPVGFLKLKESGGGRPAWPMLVPGPRATASVGIAVAHIKAPMQEVIQAARDAESVAKNAGRDGFCLIVMKRSGETHAFTAHWPLAPKWTDEQDRPNLLPVWREIMNALNEKLLANRFVYTYLQYLRPLLTGRDGKWLPEFDEDAAAACGEFLRIVIERQRKDKFKTNAELLMQYFKLGSGAVTPAEFVNFWMALAFMSKMELEDESEEGGEA